MIVQYNCDCSGQNQLIANTNTMTTCPGRYMSPISQDVVIYGRGGQGVCEPFLYAILKKTHKKCQMGWGALEHSKKCHLIFERSLIYWPFAVGYLFKNRINTYIVRHLQIRRENLERDLGKSLFKT